MASGTTRAALLAAAICLSGCMDRDVWIFTASSAAPATLTDATILVCDQAYPMVETAGVWRAEAPADCEGLATPRLAVDGQAVECQAFYVSGGGYASGGSPEYQLHVTADGCEIELERTS